MKNLLFIFRLRRIHFLIFSLFSQSSNFIEQSNLEESQLTSEQLEKWNQFKSAPKFQSTYIGQISNLSTTISPNGKVTIHLPESNCEEVEFELENVNYDSESDYSIHGTLSLPFNIQNILCGCQEGEISVSSDEFGSVGRIRLDSVIYEFHPLDENLIGIGKIDDAYFENGECFYNPSEIQNNKEKIVSDRTNGCVVRILALYSNNAQSAPGITSIRALGKASVDITNQAFSNSDIDGCDLSASLINVLPIPISFTETQNNIGADMATLINDPDISQLRNSLGADVVVLFTQGNYVGTGGGNILGASGSEVLPGGSINSNIGNPQSHLAFMIVEVSAALSNFTFTHELGHVMGARHQTCAVTFNPGCDSNGTIEHGHKWSHRFGLFCLGRKRYHSIMHQLINNRKRVLHFSNPDVQHFSQPTGDRGVSENDDWLRGGGCTVSNHMQGNDAFYVDIIGPNKGIEGSKVRLTANPTGGVPPYTYQWRESSNGVNWSGVVGTGQFFDLDLPNDQEKAYARVEAVSSDGQTAWDVHKVEIFPHFRPSSPTNVKLNKSFLLFPNPSDNGMISLKYEVDLEETEVTINLFDSFGRLLNQKVNISSSGEQLEQISIESFPEGILFVKLTNGDRTETQSFLKIK